MLHNKEHNWRVTEEYAQCEPRMTTSQWSTRQAYSKGKALRNQYVLLMHFHTQTQTHTRTHKYHLWSPSLFPAPMVNYCEARNLTVRELVQQEEWLEIAEIETLRLWKMFYSIGQVTISHLQNKPALVFRTWKCVRVGHSAFLCRNPTLHLMKKNVICLFFHFAKLDSPVWHSKNRCSSENYNLIQQNEWKWIPACNVPKSISSIRLVCRDIKKLNNPKCYFDFLNRGMLKSI